MDFLGGEGTEWEGRGDGGAGPGGGGTPAEARGVSTAFPEEPVTAALRPADLTLARAGGVARGTGKREDWLCQTAVGMRAWSKAMRAGCRGRNQRRKYFKGKMGANLL